MTQAEHQEESVSDPAGIEDLLERLRAKVEQRRAAGEYPEGLEESLNEHFHRIVHHRSTVNPADNLQADVDAIDSHATFSRARMPIDSEVPGGELLHRAINKALARQSQGILQQMQEFADATRRAIRSLAEVVQDPTSHTHGDMVGRLEALVDRLDSYERMPVDNAAALGDLRRRVEELEKVERSRGFRPWFKYEDFEAEVGRSKEALLADYRPIAEMFTGFAPVVDIGCGRGEFLELLQELEVEGWGVEIDATQAAEARERGLDVRTGDGIEVLAAEPDGSIGGIAMIQVIEHLTAQQLMDFACVAYDKLRPGGRMIIETPNPLSLYVHAYAFFLDPTHDHLVHPIYARFLFMQAGFQEVAMDWGAPPPEQDRLQTLDAGDDAAVFNANVERVNQLLFAAQNYTLIITR